jgi:UDPglucose 6-dehydrogenase
MANVCVVGLGYVGLTTALGFTKLGHDVFGVDVDENRLNTLGMGKVPMFEPGLQEELNRSLAAGSLTLSNSLLASSRDSEFYFVCVPTPQDAQGAADLRYVKQATMQIAENATPHSIIVIKSTVPVGSNQELSLGARRPDLHFASNPEFLREGTALQDFMNPDRVVVGSSSREVAEKVMALYEGVDAPKIFTSSPSAELIKYAANSYLASRLSFINDLAALCEKVDASIDDVAMGMGSDSRIGSHFLQSGPGWGGSCFPKDTKALTSLSLDKGIRLGVVEAAIESNARAFERVVEKLNGLSDLSLRGKRIAAWGIAFKANTDDTRDSPAIEIIQRLISEGCEIVCYDPVAKAPKLRGLLQVEDKMQAVSKADALLVLTEWPEFSDADPAKVAQEMSGDVVLDTRRVLPFEKWSASFGAFSVLGSA